MSDGDGGESPRKTITRADLAEAVHLKIGLPRNECTSLVETVLSLISEAAVRGENIKLSSFGSFLVREKRERIGRNPKTGAEVPIDSRRVMTFRPSSILREKVDNGSSED